MLVFGFAINRFCVLWCQKVKRREGVGIGWEVGEHYGWWRVWECIENQ